jgi:site-specific DNA-cytosine methylase
MKLGTVCTGIGGIDLGFHRAGFTPAFMCEIDEDCRNVLRRHFPGVPLFKDMREIGKHNLPPVDVLAGGTPCQGFSLAGLRGSLSDDRSNLCLQFCRIADELEPAIIVWENVPGVLSTPDNAFGCFLAALVGADAPLVPPRSIDRWRVDNEGRDVFGWTDAGVVAGPRRTAAWRVLDSQWFGVAQRRERVFVVADSGTGRAAQILFESEGMRRHSPPCRETGQRIAPTLESRVDGGGGGWGTDFVSGGGLATAAEALPKSCAPAVEGSTGRTDTPSSLPDTVGALSNGAHNGGGSTVKTPTQDALSQLPEIAWALQERDAKGPDSSTKEGHLIVTPPGGFFDDKKTFCASDYKSGEFESTDVPRPLTTSADRTRSAPIVTEQQAVAFKPSHYTRDKDGAPSEVFPPLSADADKGDQDPVVFQTRIARNGRGQPEPIVPALNGSDAGDTSDMRPCVATPTMVRRLTPIECARLQAFTPVKASVIIRACFDHQKSHANAVARSLKSLTVASVATTMVGHKHTSTDHAPSAEHRSTPNHPSASKPADGVDVHIVCGESKVDILIQGKLIMSVSDAESIERFNQRTKIGHFAHAVAHTCHVAVQVVLIGKEESPPNEPGLTHASDGKKRARKCGSATKDVASDAEKHNKQIEVPPIKFTIFADSPTGPVASTLITSFYSVWDAIAGFIPERIRDGDTFTVQLDAETDYGTWGLDEQGKRVEQSDSAQYRQYGNGVTVNVLEWIARRIKKVKP